MIYYRLNAIGQAAVTKEILEICSKNKTFTLPHFLKMPKTQEMTFMVQVVRLLKYAGL